MSQLTPRQRQVVALLGRGLSNVEIAQRLGCATGTAKLHVSAVLERLGLRNRTEVALHAQACGLVAGLTAEEIAWCHAHAAEIRTLMAASAPDRGTTAVCVGDG